MWMIILEEYKPYNVAAIYTAKDFWEAWKDFRENFGGEYVEEIYEYVEEHWTKTGGANLEGKKGQDLFEAFIDHWFQEDHTSFTIDDSKWYTLQIFKTANYKHFP
jgi:hypothetical protein